LVILRKKEDNTPDEELGDDVDDLTRHAKVAEKLRPFIAGFFRARRPKAATLDDSDDVGKRKEHEKERVVVVDLDDDEEELFSDSDDDDEQRKGTPMIASLHGGPKKT